MIRLSVSADVARLAASCAPKALRATAGSTRLLRLLVLGEPTLVVAPGADARLRAGADVFVFAQAPATDVGVRAGTPDLRMIVEAAGDAGLLGGSEAVVIVATPGGSAQLQGGGVAGVSRLDRFTAIGGGGSLSASWTTISGTSPPVGTFADTVTNPDDGFGGFLNAGAFWSADAFQADQFAECSPSPPSFGSPGTGQGAGPAVRVAAAAKTFYYAGLTLFGGSYEVNLSKVVAGVRTELARVGLADPPAMVSLEVAGSTLRVKTRAVAGGAQTTVITQADSSIASGKPGFYLGTDSGSAGSIDDWTGGFTA